MSMLETEPRTSARAARALNHRAISPVLELQFLKLGQILHFLEAIGPKS